MPPEGKGKTPSKKNKADLNDSKRDFIKEKTYLTKEVETSISILDTPENNIVIEALLFLSKYADVQISNIHFLQNCGLLPKLTSLLSRQIPIVKLSLRLLALLLISEEAVKELDKSDQTNTLLAITQMFINTNDPHIKQFTAGILAKMARSDKVIALIYTFDLFKPIFQQLKLNTVNFSKELTNNLLELLYFLLDAPSAIANLAADDVFDTHTLLTLLSTSDQITGTWVLEIFKKLSFFSINELQKQFRDNRLIESLFEIILQPANQHYHKYCFEIIINSMNNPITGSYFVESLPFLEFCQWSKLCPEDYLNDCANIFQRLTELPHLKQMLFDLSIEDPILLLLRSKDQKVINLAFKSISNMTTHKYCCDKMLTPIVFRELKKMLQPIVVNDEEQVNKIAITTLENFVKRNPQTIDYIYKYDCADLLKHFFIMGLSKIPQGLYQKILDIIMIYISKPAYQDSMLSPEFFNHLLVTFLESSDTISVTCLELMMFCTVNKGFRTAFITTNAAQKVVEKLTMTKNKEVFKHILVFIHGTFVYKKLAEAFLRARLVVTLKSLPSDLESALVQRLLKMMFNLFLPLKFYETGLLDIADKIKNRFYVINGPLDEEHFPFLDILEVINCPIKNTVYLIDYEYKLESTKTSPAATATRQAKNAPKKPPREITRISISKPPVDRYLVDYIAYIKANVSKEEPIEQQVKFIAKFIDQNMCGANADFTETDNEHTYKLHIESLKRKLMSNVIPIGHVKLGFQCERALLFKVLADKVCIPSKLIRKTYKLYWNEIPLVKPDQEIGKLQYYVVDLMNNVGEMMLEGSRCAQEYCNVKNISSECF